MEKKITRRIIGILVILALVIILLPLLFNGNESPTPVQTAEVKAPPFPEPQTSHPQVAAQSTPAAAPVAATAQPTAEAAGVAVAAPQRADEAVPAPKVEAKQGALPLFPLPSKSGGEKANTATVASTAAPSKPADENPSFTISQPAVPQPPITISLDQPKASGSKATVEQSAVPQPAVASVAQTNKNPQDDMRLINESANPLDPNPPVITHPVVVSQAKLPLSPPRSVMQARTPKPFNHVAAKAKRPHSTVAKLNKTAWVIQLGSFKNKANAQHLTNALRAKGYKAFTYEAKNSGQTRVCVGPELQQAAAVTLSQKIARDMKVHGMVLTYRPLEL